jgi:hypothetical protein
MLDCYLIEPVAESGSVKEKWNECLISFSELTQDLEQQRIFLFDYEGQTAKLSGQGSDEELRNRFEAWWSSFNTLPPYTENWQSFRQYFKSRSVILPEYPVEIQSLINALHTAKTGKVIG